jgi:hypothetical protein
MTANSEDPDPQSDIWELRLYVAGQTTKSVAAYKTICRASTRLRLSTC